MLFYLFDEMFTGYVSELNTDLTSVRFTGTNGSALSRGLCVGCYDKASKTVRISFYFNANTDLTTSTVLFTIPSEYRPSTGYASPMLFIGSSSSSLGVYTCHITTSGQIFQDAGSSIRSGIGYIEYPL